jgi:hypothetical protein
VFLGTNYYTKVVTVLGLKLYTSSLGLVRIVEEYILLKAF